MVADPLPVMTTIDFSSPNYTIIETVRTTLNCIKNCSQHIHAHTHTHSALVSRCFDGCNSAPRSSGTLRLGLRPAAAPRATAPCSSTLQKHPSAARSSRCWHAAAPNAPCSSTLRPAQPCNSTLLQHLATAPCATLSLGLQRHPAAAPTAPSSSALRNSGSRPATAPCVSLGLRQHLATWPAACLQQQHPPTAPAAALCTLQLSQIIL